MNPKEDYYMRDPDIVEVTADFFKNHPLGWLILAGGAVAVISAVAGLGAQTSVSHSRFPVHVEQGPG